MFEIVDVRQTDDGRTDDGRTPEHGYTISSPCEPKGSGELKIRPNQTGHMLRHLSFHCVHIPLFKLRHVAGQFNYNLTYCNDSKFWANCSGGAV